MKKEDIEKAALTSCEEMCISTDSWDEDMYKDGFIDGAQWRINSVWHKPEEEPKDGDYLTILDKKGRTILEIAPWRNGKYQGVHHMEVYLGWIKVVRCAPISDLLPEREEDAE